MDIIWLGHSCFRLRADEVVLITDPYPDSIGLHMEGPSALAVTISHQHENHSHWEGVHGNPKLLRGPGEYELSDVYITGIMTDAGEALSEGTRNTAYLIEMASLRLCHLGDAKSTLSTRQVEQLTPVDVLFLPVGGTCTVEVPQAIEIVRSLEPKVVIPMHYLTPGLRVELGGVEGLLRGMGLSDVQPQGRLSISASSMPQELRVVLLEPQGTAVQV